MARCSCRNVRIPPIADIGGARHTAPMKLPFLLSLLLPHKRTTEVKAREALKDCGISPNAIAWKVGADGSFAFGRKHPDADELTYEQTRCIVEWTRRERIKLSFIAWETDAP